MSRPRHLERFAERAQWRRARGIRGWQARRASRLLIKMAGRGHGQAVAEAVWKAWLRKPDDERWELLGQWRSHEALTAQVISAATNPLGAEAGRAALGEFCARHALVPADPVQQALFLVMTGQQEQHRAADPDGSLLASAYQAADTNTKAALREALAGSGDLHIIRIVAGQGQGRLTELTPADRASLTSQLAARRDWDGLWQLAQDLRLIDAVTVVRHIDGRWRPERQRDRDLFSLLTGADPGIIAPGCAATAGPIRIRVPGRVVAGALAADGRRLAVATSPSKWFAPDTISVYALPGGALVTRRPSGILNGGANHVELLYSGTTLVATPSSLAPWPTLVCFADGEDAEPRIHRTSTITGIAACERGFVTVSWDGCIRFHHDDGVAYESHATPEPHPPLADPIIAVEPDSGQLAAVLNHCLVVMDASDPRSVRRLCQAAGSDWYRYLCLAGPDRVIAGIRDVGLRLWDFGGAGGWQAPRTATANKHGFVSPVVVAARDEICVLGDDFVDRDDSRSASYLDAKTLRTVDEHREFSGRSGTLLMSSPGNTWHALGGNRFVDVVTSESLALRGIGDRPQSAWRPADLIAARKAAGIVEGNPDTRPWYDLLLACLEHRFGAEVRLGRRLPDLGDDEIGTAPA